jgi:Zn-dependent protease with chaperone function
MLTYILQVVFFQLLFLLVYEFLLKKETFFSYNRWYLLLTPVLALILPLLKIESLGSLVPAEGFMMLPNVYLNDSMVSQVSAETTIQIFSENNWWWTIYAGGILGSLVVFIKKYQALNKMFQFQVVFNDESVRIIRVPNSNIACTYFNTVFLGDQLSGTEEQQIMSHEMVHVKQNHSADLLFFEMLKIFLWFNPLVYIYQSRLSVLHEFMADAGALKTSKKQSYYQQLLNTAFNTKNISFINQFYNQSLIKKRIVMLQKSRSKTIAKFKYLILVPLMLVMLIYVSCTQDNPLPPSSPNVQLNENGDVPFAVIEQVPVFTIDKNGHVTDVHYREPDPRLEQEAERVINSLPKMQPGKQRGKPVGVMYSLPIVFQVGE